MGRQQTTAHHNNSYKKSYLVCIQIIACSRDCFIVVDFLF